MRHTFVRTGMAVKACPWCGRAPVRFRAKKKAVYFACTAPKPCGYTAWIPKV